MNDLTISLMELNDISEATKVLSSAMLKNPVHVAVYQGQGEEQRLEIERNFADLFHTHPGVVFLGKRRGRIEGVMRMKSCLGDQVPEKDVPGEDAQDRASRISHWHNLWDQNDLRKLHWHLGPIGVLPSAQGSGIGTSLMNRFCQEVDTCQAAAYLETDMDYNVRFYQKFGFEVCDQVDVFGVESTFMLRPALLKT